MRKICVIILLIPVFSAFFRVSAVNEDYEKYYDEIYSSLQQSVEDDVWEKIEDFGFDSFAQDGIYSDSFDKIGEYFSQCFSDRLSAVGSCFFTLLLILILSSTVKSFGLTEKSINISFLTSAVIVLVTTANINDVINALLSSMKSASAFMLAYIPVYTVVISLSGNVSSALSYNTLTVVFAQGISLLINNLAVDIIGIYLSLSIAFSFNSMMNLNRFVSAVSRLVNVAIGFVAGLFSSLLTLRGALAVSVDSAAAKGLKLLLGSLIPVVGSSISDAYSSVVGSISIMKGSVAAIGIAAMLIISVPPIIEGGMYCLTFAFLEYIADIMSEKEGGAVLHAISVGLKTVTVVSVLQVFILIISTGIMLVVKAAV